MAAVLTDLGADVILKVFFNNDWPDAGNNLFLRLFTNNYTPVDTSVTGDFTEASGGGYAEITLSRGSWTVTVGHDPSDATYAQQTFTFTGPLAGSASVYGYFVADADDVTIFAETFVYPFTPYYNGDLVKITPLVKLSKGTTS